MAAFCRNILRGSLTLAPRDEVHEEFEDQSLKRLLIEVFEPGLFVDALHDHRAIERGTGVPSGQRLAGQPAGLHHRIGRHLADEGFTGGAVDDLGGGGNEHAHGEHRAAAHDHAFDHFRAGADEASRPR